jgi:hypothetical protein
MLYFDIVERTLESYPGWSSTVMMKPDRFSVSHNSMCSDREVFCESDSIPAIPPKDL